jgi:hypothetical protein
MLRISIVLVGAVVLRGGCGRMDDEGTSLGVEESALFDDESDAEELDSQIEAGIEEPLSGAEPADPGSALTPDVPQATAMASLRTNPGKFFQPAGCIVTTVAGNVATHVFTSCTGPYGLTSFNGTVTSTWTFGAGLSVKHEATGFKINGATITGSVTLSYTKSGTVYSKTRNGSWMGKTSAGKDITRTANYQGSYDATTKCITRSGTATTTVGARSLEASVTNYKRCGIGALGCPMSGTVTLTRKPSGLSLTLTFPGGAKVVITGPLGRMVTRPLVCRP